MPRLTTNDPLIVASEAFRRVETSLPDLVDIARTEETQVLELARKAWGTVASNNFIISAQREVGRMMTSTGLQGYLATAAENVLKIPPVALETGKLLLDLLPKDLVKMLASEVRELLAEVVTEIVGSLIDVFAAIPVVGWILDMVWDVAMGVVNIVKLAQESNAPPPPHKIRAYQPHPETDKLRANWLLDLSATTDWTFLVMPPGIDRNTSWGEYFVSTLVDPHGGRRIVSRGLKTDWLGYIPDTTLLHRELEIFPEARSILDIGDPNPSTRQLAITMWGQCQTNTPGGLTINASLAAKMWGGYLDQLRDFLESDESGLAPETQTKTINALDDRFGWGRAGARDIDAATPVRALRRLADNQSRFLDTYTACYVDHTWGAFGDSALASKLEERQGQALARNDVVCNLELDLVPHPLRGIFEWRKSEIGVGPCYSVGGVQKPTASTYRAPGRLARQPTLEGTGDEALATAPQLPLNRAPLSQGLAAATTSTPSTGEPAAADDPGAIETALLVLLFLLRGGL